VVLDSARPVAELGSGVAEALLDYALLADRVGRGRVCLRRCGGGASARAHETLAPPPGRPAARAPGTGFGDRFPRPADHRAAEPAAGDRRRHHTPRRRPARCGARPGGGPRARGATRRPARRRPRARGQVPHRADPPLRRNTPLPPPVPPALLRRGTGRTLRELPPLHRGHRMAVVAGRKWGPNGAGAMALSGMRLSNGRSGGRDPRTLRTPCSRWMTRVFPERDLGVSRAANATRVFRWPNWYPSIPPPSNHWPSPKRKLAL